MTGASRSLAVAFLAMLALAGCVTSGAKDPPVSQAPATERIIGYASVGRIKWTVPENAGFYFAVPHFTAGPRLKCDFPGGGQCEISVHPRVLATDSAKRQSEYFAQMRALLPGAVEKSVEVRSYGSGSPVLYATLTDRSTNSGYRHLTRGLYVKGTFVVEFYHATGDASGTELDRILRVVHSAEPLDALAFLSWKLSDYKAICEEQFPPLKAANDAAFSASMFANVDWVGLLQAQNPDMTRGKIAALFEQARQELAAELAKGPADEWERFCRAYPRQVDEAQKGM